MDRSVFLAPVHFLPAEFFGDLYVCYVISPEYFDIGV